jgi:hypothetical protein
MLCKDCKHWHKREIDTLAGVKEPTAGICRAPDQKMYCPDADGEPQDIETQHDFGCVLFLVKF